MIGLHYVTDLVHITSGSLTQIDIEELTVFCSEFVSIIYIALGILDKTVVPYNITPVNILHNYADIFTGSPKHIK